MSIWIYIEFVEERQSELVPAHLRLKYQLDSNKGNDSEDADRAKEHQPCEGPVGNGRISTRQQEPPDL
jgi:hypothetical protein